MLEGDERHIGFLRPSLGRAATATHPAREDRSFAGDGESVEFRQKKLVSLSASSAISP